MSDKPTPEILNFSLSSLSDSSNFDPKANAVPSHLSPARATRPEHSTRANVKRIKPNTKHRNEEHSLKQLHVAKTLVEEAIDLVLDSGPLKYGYGFYYQKVESICKYKHAEQSRLADQLKQKIEHTFYYSIKPRIVSLVHNDSITVKQFIQLYLNIYQEWESKLRLLGKLFLYIDRNYLLPHPNKKVILELGLDLFITNLLADHIEEADLTIAKYNQFLVEYQSLLELSSHADSEADYKLLESITKTLIKLNFNNRIKLNPTVVTLVIEIFRHFKLHWFKHPESYIHNVLSKMSQIVTFYKECGQSKEFCETLLVKLKWEMIFINFNETIEKCLPHMLRSTGGERQLRMIYKFCDRSFQEYAFDSISMLIYEWGKLIITEIVTAIQDFNESDQTGSKNIIPVLVKINDDFKAVVKQNFDNNERFEFEIRNSFNKALNNDKRKTGFIISQLCKYIETYFKTKKPSSVSFKQFEDSFLVVFKYLNNKNDFIIIYKRELSKRLLLSKNLQIDLEKKLAESMFKVIGETDDSMGLNIMFKDLKVSQEKFNGVELKQKLNSSIEFQPLILEQKHWPEIPKLNNSAITSMPASRNNSTDQNDNGIVLPARFVELIERFSDIYKQLDEKYKNHRLDWDNYQLHQMIIIGHFDSGDYELQVNLLQAIIVDLFNDRQQLTVEEIIKATGMDLKLLKRLLHSLTEKYKILVEDKSSQIISFNKGFSDKSKKLRLPVPKTIDRDANNTIDSDKKILKNRDLEIRSVVIRIIKTDTKMLFTDLINQTLMKISERGRGPINLADIKNNIEYLIQNEFISRDGDNKTLTYVP